MSGLSYGFKTFGVLTFGTDTPNSQQVAWFPEHTAAVLEVTGNEEIIQAYINGGTTGKLSPFKVFEEAEEFSLTVTAVGMNFHNLQLLVGEHASTTSSLARKVAKRTVVNASTYTITDSDFAGLAATDVQATLAIKSSAYGSPREFTIATSGSATANTAILDNSANTLTFASSLGGATVDYFVSQPKSNVRTIGHEANPSRITYLGWRGILGTDEYLSTEGIEIVIPRMQRTRSYSLDSSSREYEIVFTPVLAPGETSVIKYAEILAA
jgi:hypothetical protein